MTLYTSKSKKRQEINSPDFITQQNNCSIMHTYMAYIFTFFKGNKALEWEKQKLKHYPP